jgi:CDP-ribitol ribitolphosphotransferase
MKVLLYCAHSYSVAILAPLGEEAGRRGYEVLWYCPSRFADKLPEGVRHVLTHQQAYEFKSDIIFVPGNDVPFYFRGLKVQVFHGFAGEKKGHFRVRGYFDLYLTQGPYFTERFLALRERHRNFEVTETGWSKLDPYFNQSTSSLKKSRIKPALLYAPTFSPRLTSAQVLIDVVPSLAEAFNVTVKFHPLACHTIVNAYRTRFSKLQGVTLSAEEDVCSLVVESDLVLSDTSSVVYEALILNRGVVTFKSSSQDCSWRDVDRSDEVLQACLDTAADSSLRGGVIRRRYHPYDDGLSSARMLSAAEAHVQKFGIPESRTVSLARKIRYLKDLRLW